MKLRDSAFIAIAIGVIHRLRPESRSEKFFHDSTNTAKSMPWITLSCNTYTIKDYARMYLYGAEIIVFVDGSVVPDRQYKSVVMVGLELPATYSRTDSAFVLILTSGEYAFRGFILQPGLLSLRPLPVEREFSSGLHVHLVCARTIIFTMEAILVPPQTDGQFGQ